MATTEEKMVKLEEPKAKMLKKSFYILEYAEESTRSFLNTLNKARELTNSKGTTSHSEQDLLRAMVVFAGAGLDSTLKQLVKDTLQTIVLENEDAQKKLEDFAIRSLRTGKKGQDLGGTDNEKLAQILLAESPKEAFVKLLKEDLIGDSLQSREQIFKLIKHLGLEESKLKIDGKNIDAKKLDSIFKCRNQIIHEMDMNIAERSIGKRKRNPRNTKEMKDFAEYLLNLGNVVLTQVDSILPQSKKAKKRENQKKR